MGVDTARETTTEEKETGVGEGEVGADQGRGLSKSDLTFSFLRQSSIAGREATGTGATGEIVMGDTKNNLFLQVEYCIFYSRDRDRDRDEREKKVKKEKRSRSRSRCN